MTTVAVSSAIAESVAEQAAAWFLRLHDAGCTAEQRRAFDAWFDASETHRREYRQFELLWQRLDQVGHPSRRRARKLKAVAATLAVCGVALALLLPRFGAIGGEEVISTAHGERKRVTLADGTVVDLNSATTLRTRFTSSRRDIVLDGGEALFAVAPDSARPFEVRARGGIVRDIGTTFDVLDEAGRVTVAVVEGKVAIGLANRPRMEVAVAAGMQASYSAEGVTPPVALDAEAATAWRDGRWLFHDTPLDEVLRAMNRQHARQTVLADPALARLRVSGAFNIADRDGLLLALQTLFALRGEERGEATYLAWARTP